MAFEPLQPPVFSIKPKEEWPLGSVCRCLRNRKDGTPCGHVWRTRQSGKPAACAKCKQSFWDRIPKKRNAK